MTRRRYTAEFKKEAARMIIIDGTPVLEVAQQLGVGSQMLYRWKGTPGRIGNSHNPRGS